MGSCSQHIRHLAACRAIFFFKHHGRYSALERLRRWTRNPLGSARRGSNPLAVALDVGRSFRRYTVCSKQFESGSGITHRSHSERPLREFALQTDTCGVQTHALSEWRLEPPPSTARPKCLHSTTCQYYILSACHSA